MGARWAELTIESMPVPYPSDIGGYSSPPTLTTAIEDTLQPHNQLVMRSLPALTNPNPDLDAVFAAPAEPTRRAMLARLVQGDASVGERGVPLEMSQPAISKYVKVLERAGLVERRIDGTCRPVQLRSEALAAANQWRDDYRALVGRVSNNSMHFCIAHEDRAGPSRRRRHPAAPHTATLQSDRSGGRVLPGFQ